jgi:hypothetical protein
MPARIDPITADAEMRDAGVTPLVDYPGAEKPWASRCNTCGALITPSLSKVRGGRKACRHCSRNGAASKRRMSEEDATREMQENGNASPLEPFPGLIHAPWKCQCNSCHAVITPSLHNIRAGHGACAPCGHTRGGRKRRTPASAAIDEMQHTGNATPLVPYPGRIDEPWLCACNVCNSKITPTLGNVRIRQGSACKPCGTQRGSKAQKIPDETAKQLMRSRDVEPTEPYPGFNKRWACTCNTCGRKAAPTLGNALKGHNPCSHCTGNARYTDAEARSVMIRQCDATPTEAYPGANKPWRATCNKCNRSITPTFANARKFGACKYCAEHGFDYAKPSVVYLITFRFDEWLTIAKVGIANSHSGRLTMHTRRGWRIVDSIEVPTGEQARAIESTVLCRWRDSGALPISRNLVPAGDGWTETANVEDIVGLTPDLAEFASVEQRLS